jgi:hypothetical protein
MKPTESRRTKSSAPSSTPKTATKRDAQSAPELDRRGKPLPPRQRVGGIITPQ